MTDAAGLNIADALVAIGAAVPDNMAVIHGARRLDWSSFVARSSQFANALAGAGIGRRPLPPASNWESPHHHVGLFLTNGTEYLESMVGAWLAGAVAINVNYRYTADELVQLLDDADAIGLVYHRRFAATVAEAMPKLPSLQTLVHVEDGSTGPPVPGSVEYESWIATCPAEPPDLPRSGDDRYVVYTGGTTGSPKGVLWRQADFVVSALGITATVDELVERARRPRRPVALPAPPFMHGAAHWNALSCLLAGGTVVIQDETERLDPADVLDTCERHRVGSLLIVGDAFARPLLDELRVRPRPLASLRTLMTGGAVLSPSIKDAFVELLPHLRVVDILGSSETGRHGIATTSSDEAGSTAGFRPSETTVVLSADRSRALTAGDDEVGWLAQIGRVPLGYLHDQAKTEATFPVIDGRRHAVAGDRARLDTDGTIQLLGRDSVTINTGGEKVHAEEVEQVLKDDPQIYDALVVGRPSTRWGSEIVAVVSCPGGHFDPAVAGERAGRHLARYKLPKEYIVVEAVERSASGKPDYAWARALAAATAESS